MITEQEDTLKDLGAICDEICRVIQAFNTDDVIFSEGFKKTFTEYMRTLGDKNDAEFKKTTAIITNKKGQKIYAPNYCFILASYPIELIRETDRYKICAEKVVDKILQTEEYWAKKYEGAVKADEKAKVRESLYQTLKSNDSKDIKDKFKSLTQQYFKGQGIEESQVNKNTDLLYKFVTDYQWWCGGKTINRADYYISPTLGVLNLENASHEYVASKIVKGYLSYEKLHKELPNMIYSESDGDISVDIEEDENMKPQVREEKVPHKVTHEIKGINKIYFGAPGTGKSFSIKNFIYEEFKKDSTYQLEKWEEIFLDDKLDNPNVFRTTLHPEFTYNDFVGQLQPKKNGKSITYDFVPKIFTQALTAAIRHPKSPIFLVLEELSRANVAAVFGDIFQLLDRSADGSSEYSIDNDSILQGIEDIYQSYVVEGTEDEREVYLGDKHRGKKIFIPRNLFIIGTVNTSDQNVFVMDTAFKRRFEFDYMDANDVVYDLEGREKNNFKIKLEGISSEVRKLEMSWIDLYRKLNSFITAKEDKGLGLSEDKQLGQFFLKFEEDTDDNKKFNNAQLYGKLLQYLWEDIKLASYSDKQLFDTELDTFSQAYRRMKDGENVFHQDFMDYPPRS